MPGVNYMAILPEILILVLGILILILDPLWKKDETRRVALGWLAGGGLMAVLGISLLLGRPVESTIVWGGMLSYDWFGFAFKMFFIFAAAMTALFMMDVEKLNTRPEAYLLLLASTMGMNLMASAADLVMLYLAIELTSIPMYVLSGFLLDDKKSTESGFKYLLFGVLTSTVMLYGFSLLYGFAGTTNLFAISAQFPAFTVVTFAVIFLVLVGLAFKTSAVPFHFWAPDVYEGAPTPVAGFLSTASKAAGFAVLIRVFMVGFPQVAENWTLILAIVATLSMTIGNFIALPQVLSKDKGNIKRLLAFSSISHAGYALIGVVANSQLGVTSVVFYLLAYIATNLAAFGAVIAFGRLSGTDEFKAYWGLSRRSPWLALVFLVSFLSLAGMPPFGGFVAKVMVFAAAIASGWYWLAFVGIFNSIIGVYYYLTVLKYIYLYRAENESEEKQPLALTRPYAIALTVLSIAVILVGSIFAPWFDLSELAALSLPF